MYSKKAWGGDTDPFIETTFIKTSPPGDEDPLVSLVIFEWNDEDLVGVWPSDDAPKVCTIGQPWEFDIDFRGCRKPLFATTALLPPNIVILHRSGNSF